MNELYGLTLLEQFRALSAYFFWALVCLLFFLAGRRAEKLRQDRDQADGKNLGESARRQIKDRDEVIAGQAERIRDLEEHLEQAGIVRRAALVQSQKVTEILAITEVDEVAGRRRA